MLMVRGCEEGEWNRWHRGGGKGPDRLAREVDVADEVATAEA